MCCSTFALPRLQTTDPVCGERPNRDRTNELSIVRQHPAEGDLSSEYGCSPHWLHGVTETDVIMLVMNSSGADRLKQSHRGPNRAGRAVLDEQDPHAAFQWGERKPAIYVADNG